MSLHNDKNAVQVRPAVPTPQPSATFPHPLNPFPAGRLQFDEGKASEGEALFREVIGRHPELDVFYGSVDRRSLSRGFGVFINIPEGDWTTLGTEQRQSLGHFMCRESPINGWAIYLGHIDGRDIMTDRTGMSSKEWKDVQPLR